MMLVGYYKTELWGVQIFRTGHAEETALFSNVDFWLCKKLMSKAFPVRM